MSQQLFNLNDDLGRLREDGYTVFVRGGCLFVDDVPYLNTDGDISRGTVISTLTLAGQKTQRPDTHVAYFVGAAPCGADGKPNHRLIIGSQKVSVAGNIKADHTLSRKPPRGYADYYEKMTTYVDIISGPAKVLDQTTSARRSRPIPGDEESIFEYIDTATARAGIPHLAQKLSGQKIAIVGVGGSGSYVLDFVAKTPVGEIHLFDEDDLLTHNAFRAPGAASLEELDQRPKKVYYYKEVYSSMHRGIFAHPELMSKKNLPMLDGMDFVFVCMDGGPTKRAIFDYLIERKIPFSDTGLGVVLGDGGILGQVRCSSSTPKQFAHLDDLDFSDTADEDVYKSNIQIAELNALSAVMAVIKWKKIFEFYQDDEREHHTVYVIDGSVMINANHH